MTKIISAFPACGKTYHYSHIHGITALDSDSSQFSWIDTIDREYEQRYRGRKDYHERKIKVRNPDFPNNYIKHIKENIGKVDYIFVSSHAVVRQALKDNNIPYIVVYPDRSLKDEWVGRCFIRGNDVDFCKRISENWDNWIDEMQAENNGYVLQHGQYLSDILPYVNLDQKYENIQVKLMPDNPIIVIQYSKDTTFIEAAHILENVKKMFPKHKVVAIPDKINLSTMTETQICEVKDRFVEWCYKLSNQKN